MPGSTLVQIPANSVNGRTLGQELYGIWPTSQVLRQSRTSKPAAAAWLIPADDKISLLIGMFFAGSCIVRTQLFGVELAGLVVRFYFGTTDCIIPVGGFLDWHKDIVAFTLAGPCDSDGRKEFYMFCYSPRHVILVSGLNRICGLQGFATIA
ncbi:hypothetical protein B0H13DRAFT_2331665 [Mycena leptocephala]|nr:hypothetical protein B0H13DRAFT_2331665 [Mycena leptocephala]